MLLAQHHCYLSPNFLLPLSSVPSPSSSCLHFPSKPPPASLCAAQKTWLAQASEQPSSAATTTTVPPQDEGPVEIPQSSPSIFADSDDPTPLQTATSILLTGAISVFLFRSLRRRAKRAQELKFRSSGAKKSLKEEAVESLKAVSLSPVTSKSPPSPVQALLGALAAGVIALILYKFTLTIESSLNRQTLSDNYSVRQITITIRTIVNGLCYLATFVFGANSLGLFLYSGQLALNSIMGDSTGGDTENKNKAEQRSPNIEIKDTSDSSAMTSGAIENQSSDNKQ